MTLDFKPPCLSWGRVPIPQVVVWKLYSVKVVSFVFAPCRPHLAPVTVIYICVSGVVRRLAGDGCLHVQQRLVAPAYLLHVTAISEPDCSPLLILCTAQSGPKNLKLFLLKTNHLRMLKTLRRKAPRASIHQTQRHGNRKGSLWPYPGASYLPKLRSSLHPGK